MENYLHALFPIFIHRRMRRLGIESLLNKRARNEHYKPNRRTKYETMKFTHILVMLSGQLVKLPNLIGRQYFHLQNVCIG